MGALRRPLPFCFTVILLIATVSGAQQQESIALTDFPVPAWPADGNVPAEMKDKYVFVDLTKNEYVLAYPSNLGTPNFEKDGPGPVRTARYELLRNVEPTASVVVTATDATKYKYVYTVANGAGAKQSIDQWTVVGPPEAQNDTINKPAGWFGVIQRERNFKLKNPDWTKNGTALVWSFQKPEEVIQPGSKKTGFELVSELRPGFQVGYFRKAESVEAVVAASGNIPAPVKEQKDALLIVEYNSKTEVVIGPKFTKDTDDRTIAADFVRGINYRVRTGALNADSEFVKATLAELNRFAGAGPPIRLTAQPRNEAETEVFNALKVSLKVN